MCDWFLILELVEDYDIVIVDNLLSKLLVSVGMLGVVIYVIILIEFEYDLIDGVFMLFNWVDCINEDW